MKDYGGSLEQFLKGELDVVDDGSGSKELFLLLQENVGSRARAVGGEAPGVMF